MSIEDILIFVGIIVLFLLEALFEVALLSSAGAFARRIFVPKQKSFKEYYKENTLLNSIVGLVALIITVAVIVGIFRLVIS